MKLLKRYINYKKEEFNKVTNNLWSNKASFKGKVKTLESQWRD